MWPYFNPTIKVVTFRLRGWCVLGMFFVASIHPSRTWTSGSFESVRLNACVHRLDLGLYSHSKEFLGEWSLNSCYLQGKNPLYWKISPEEDRTRDAVDSEPKHYQRAIPAPSEEIQLISYGNQKLSVVTGTLLCVFGSRESHCKLKSRDVHPIETDTKARHSSSLTLLWNGQLAEIGRPTYL